MGLDEAEVIWNQMVEFFGKNFANPEREPRRFEYQMRFYKYIMGPKA